MSRILLIGDIDLHKIPYNGEKMKNQLFLKRLKEVSERVIPVDTREWRKRPWCLLYLFLCLIFCHPCKVVISSCDVSAYRVIKFLYYFRVQKDVYYWVVGGGFHHLVADGSLNAKYYHYLKKILVQSPEMQTSLEQAGLDNVLYVPNSKPIYPIEPQMVGEKISFVFFSRIEPTKGCDLIFNVVRRLHSQGFKDRFCVCFYGQIASDYEAAFRKEVDSMPDVFYKGVLDLTNRKGYEELANNDVFLFPTFYANEGFPGVVIDAYISGLPIIASDWHFNAEIVRNGVTGVIIPAKDEDALYETMKSFINAEYDIEKMKRNCLAEAPKYDINNVLSEDFLKSIGLI